MAKGTPATVALEKAGIAFKLHEYDYDPNAERIGMQAADALGVSPQRLLKTLMAKAGGQPVCVVIASDHEVSLKKLAAAAGTKDAAMLPAAEAERITGYHVGGNFTARPEEAAQSFHRRRGDGAPDHHLQRRQAWVTNRDSARRSREAAERDSRRDRQLAERYSAA